MRRRELKRQKGAWLPSPISSLELNSASGSNLPFISTPQCDSVKAWLLDLGLCVLEGEGGYGFSPINLNTQQSPSSSTAPILTLTQDRFIM